jgi:hypothetical protein
LKNPLEIGYKKEIERDGKELPEFCFHPLQFGFTLFQRGNIFDHSE